MKAILKKIIYMICWVFISPLVALQKVTGSRELFAGQAQLLALCPGKIGSYLRVAYYVPTLNSCSRDMYIGFGSFFAHPEAEVGLGVYIGAYCIIGMAKIDKHATIGSNVHILSGKQQHGYKEIGKPIQQQAGCFTSISIGENCWIGNSSVIMANLGRQNVIGAGSGVLNATGDYEMLAGNPAALIKMIVKT